MHGLCFDRKLLNHEEKVNPSAPQHRCWDLPSARAQAEGSGLTLSGALHTTLKDRAWRRRMGQYDIILLSPVIEMDRENMTKIFSRLGEGV